MTASDYISFEDFISRASQTTNTEQISEEEILGDVEWILHSLRGDTHGDI